MQCIGSFYPINVRYILIEVIEMCVFTSKVIISKPFKKFKLFLLRFMTYIFGFLICLNFLSPIFKTWRLGRGHLKTNRTLGWGDFFFRKREFYPILSSWNLISPIENRYFSFNQAILLCVIQHTALWITTAQYCNFKKNKLAIVKRVAFTNRNKDICKCHKSSLIENQRAKALFVKRCKVALLLISSYRFSYSWLCRSFFLYII